jgi:hypothetical protein
MSLKSRLDELEKVAAPGCDPMVINVVYDGEETVRATEEQAAQYRKDNNLCSICKGQCILVWMDGALKNFML